MAKACSWRGEPAVTTQQAHGLEMRFVSDPANVAVVRRAIESLSAANGFDERSAWEIGLSVNEALANVIRHAYRGAIDRPVEIKARFRGNHLRIDIRDWGSGENPDALLTAEYDPLTPGGLGMVCLRQLMDRVDYVPQPDGMLLSLEKRRRAGVVATKRDGAVK